MRNSVSVRSDDRNEDYGSIVSDLVSLIEQVETGTKPIEQAIAMEPSLGNREGAANFVAPDDVTARNLRAGAASITCNADLAKFSQHRTNVSAACDLRSARLVGRA